MHRLKFPIGAILLFCILGGGCTHILAERMVQAPNHDAKPEERMDAPQQLLDELYVNQQLRVPVGPPDATLSVFVIDPFSGAGEVELVKPEGRRLEARITRKPSTRPTTQPIAIKGTIFVIHGIEDHKELGPYVLYREMLVHAGYRCIQLDMRGHGRSTGEWITWGAVESHDLVQVLDYLEAQGLIEGKIGVLGVSYGAATAIQWAGIDPRISAIVALEPYCTLYDAARDGADFVLADKRWLFSNKDIRNAVDEAGRIAGFNPADVNAIEAIKRTHAPVLLIHSRSDELIPWSHSQRLHDAAPDHSKLILVNNQSHFDMWLKSMELIRGASLAWFEKYVGPKKAATTASATKVALPAGAQ